MAGDGIANLEGFGVSGLRVQGIQGRVGLRHIPPHNRFGRPFGITASRIQPGSHESTACRPKAQVLWNMS